MKTRPTTLALAGLLATALALRLYRLDEGLWLDEVSTWIRYMRLPLTTIPTVYGSENQHFLFSLLAKLSLMTFGESVWAFRLPAVLFGVASIWAMYVFGKEAGSQKEGLLSAGLLTFSYHHVWFSQNARGYTGLLFFTLLSSWLLLRALREDRRLLWAGYALAAALGVYTQATMAFLLLCHAAIALWYACRRRRFSGPALGLGAGAALTVLLHAPALGEIVRGLHATVSVVTEWRQPLWTLTELAGGLRAGFTSAVVAASALVLFGAGVWSYWKTRPAVVGLLILPALVGTAILLATGHHIWPRFYFFTFGFAALVVVRGAMLLGRAGTPLAIALIAVSALSTPLAYGPKQDFGAAYRYLRENQQPGDAVVTADLSAWVYRGFYGAGWPEVTFTAQLDQIRARSRRTWFVYTLEPALRVQLPDVLSNVRSEFQVVKIFPGTLKNGEVVVCLAYAKFENRSQ